MQHVVQQLRACDQFPKDHPLIRLIEQCLQNIPAKRPGISHVLCSLEEAKDGIKNDQEIERNQMELALRRELPTHVLKV